MVQGLIACQTSIPLSSATRSNSPLFKPSPTHIGGGDNLVRPQQRPQA
jgi:hypothetical protein